MGKGVSVGMEEYLTPLTFIFFGIPNSYFFFLPNAVSVFEKFIEATIFWKPDYSSIYSSVVS